MTTPDSTVDRTDNPGAIIRRLRRGVGMTLNELSTKTGIAASTLSKLEVGHVSLSYDKLSAISRGLGVDMAELLGSPSPSTSPAPGGGRRVFLRAGEGRLVETQSYKQLYVATELLNKRMTPLVVEIRARSMDEFRAEFGDFIRHPGEEFVYVLEGEIEFCTDLYEPLRMQAGDTLYFDSEMGHAYLKASDATCRIVAACAPRGSLEPMIDKFVTASQKQKRAEAAAPAQGGAAAKRSRRSK